MANSEDKQTVIMHVAMQAVMVVVRATREADKLKHIPLNHIQEAAQKNLIDQGKLDQPESTSI